MAEARHVLLGLEVQNTRFESWMGAVEGRVCCRVSCDRGVQGWVQLDADGTMKKVLKSMQQNPMSTLAPTLVDCRVQECVRRTHKVLDYKMTSALLYI